MNRSVFIFLAIFFITINLFADSFKDFKKGMMNEFKSNDEYETYKKDITQEFELYKKVLNEEFNKYLKEIGQFWEDKKVSDNKVFVEYSDDKKTRKIIDYENDKFIVEIRGDNLNKNEAESKFKKSVEDTINENLKVAYHRDQVSVNVENRLKFTIKSGVTGKIPDTKILSPYITDKKDIIQIKDASDNAKFETVKDKNGTVYKYEMKLPSKELKEKVDFVKDYVFKHSTEHRINPEIVFSIIHNESYFNPMAKSYVPAYGLMQIVPQSAGMDATKFLFGKAQVLLPSYLYNPDNNVKVGAAYFHILYYSYLKEIKNPTSRLYCSIAAYNTGAGNVAKAFVGSYNIKSATNVINRMSPDDVYRTLKRDLPYEETRRYLDKVLDKIEIYKPL